MTQYLNVKWLFHDRRSRLNEPRLQEETQLPFGPEPTIHGDIGLSRWAFTLRLLA